MAVAWRRRTNEHGQAYCNPPLTGFTATFTQFHADGLMVGAPEFNEDDLYGSRTFEASVVRPQNLTFPYEAGPTLSIVYEYDFGDCRRHLISLRRLPCKTARLTRAALQARAQTHRKTPVVNPAMPTFSRLGSTRPTMATKTCADGLTASSIPSAAGIEK